MIRQARISPAWVLLATLNLWSAGFLARPAFADGENNLRVRPGERLLLDSRQYVDLSRSGAIEFWLRFQTIPAQSFVYQTVVLSAGNESQLCFAVIVDPGIAGNARLGVINDLAVLGDEARLRSAMVELAVENEFGMVGPVKLEPTKLYHVVLAQPQGRTEINVFFEGRHCATVYGAAFGMKPGMPLCIGEPQGGRPKNARGDAMAFAFDGYVGGLRLWRDGELTHKEAHGLMRFGRSVDPLELTRLALFGDLIAYADFVGRRWDPARRTYVADAPPRLRFPDPFAGVWFAEGATVDQTNPQASVFDDYPVFSFVPSARAALPPSVEERRYQVFEDANYIGELTPVAGAAERWRFQHADDGWPPIDVVHRPAHRGWVLDCTVPRLPEGRQLAGKAAGRLTLRRRTLAELGIETLSQRRLTLDEQKKKQAASDAMSLVFLYTAYPLFFNRLYGSYNIVTMDPWNLLQSGVHTDHTGATPGVLRVPEADQMFELKKSDQLIMPYDLSVLHKNMSLDSSTSRLVSSAREYNTALTARLGLGISGSVQAGVNFIAQAQGSINMSLVVQGAFVREVAQNHSESSERIVRTKWTSLYTLYHKKDLIRLSDAFENALRELCDACRYAAKEQQQQRLYEFFDRWGTHYPFAADFGSLELSDTIVTEEMKKLAGKLQSSFFLTINEGQSGVEYMASNATEERRRVADTTVRSLGEPGKPVPIALDLRPLHDLLTPQHFPHEPDVYGWLRRLLIGGLAAYRVDRIAGILDELPEHRRKEVLRGLTEAPPSTAEQPKRDTLALRYTGISVEPTTRWLDPAVAGNATTLTESLGKGAKSTKERIKEHAKEHEQQRDRASLRVPFDGEVRVEPILIEDSHVLNLEPRTRALLRGYKRLVHSPGPTTLVPLRARSEGFRWLDVKLPGPQPFGGVNREYRCSIPRSHSMNAHFGLCIRARLRIDPEASFKPVFRGQVIVEVPNVLRQVEIVEATGMPGGGVSLGGRPDPFWTGRPAGESSSTLEGQIAQALLAQYGTMPANDYWRKLGTDGGILWADVEPVDVVLWPAWVDAFERGSWKTHLGGRRVARAKWTFPKMRDADGQVYAFRTPPEDGGWHAGFVAFPIRASGKTRLGAERTADILLAKLHYEQARIKERSLVESFQEPGTLAGGNWGTFVPGAKTPEIDRWSSRSTRNLREAPQPPVASSLAERIGLPPDFAVEAHVLGPVVLHDQRINAVGLGMNESGELTCRPVASSLRRIWAFLEHAPGEWRIVNTIDHRVLTAEGGANEGSATEGSATQGSATEGNNVALRAARPGAASQLWIPMLMRGPSGREDCYRLRSKSTGNFLTASFSTELTDGTRGFDPRLTLTPYTEPADVAVSGTRYRSQRFYIAPLPASRLRPNSQLRVIDSSLVAAAIAELAAAVRASRRPVPEFGQASFARDLWQELVGAFDADRSGAIDPGERTHSVLAQLMSSATFPPGAGPVTLERYQPKVEATFHQLRQRGTPPVTLVLEELCGQVREFRLAAASRRLLAALDLNGDAALDTNEAEALLGHLESVFPANRLTPAELDRHRRDGRVTAPELTAAIVAMLQQRPAVAIMVTPAEELVAAITALQRPYPTYGEPTFESAFEGELLAFLDESRNGTLEPAELPGGVPFATHKARSLQRLKSAPDAPGLAAFEVRHMRQVRLESAVARYLEALDLNRDGVIDPSEAGELLATLAKTALGPVAFDDLRAAHSKERVLRDQEIAATILAAVRRLPARDARRRAEADSSAPSRRQLAQRIARDTAALVREGRDRGRQDQEIELDVRELVARLFLLVDENRNGALDVAEAAPILIGLAAVSRGDEAGNKVGDKVEPNAAIPWRNVDVGHGPAKTGAGDGKLDADELVGWLLRR